jgi:hypothetical protein
MNVRCESLAIQYVSTSLSAASGAALNMPLHAQKFQRSTSPNEDVTMPAWLVNYAERHRAGLRVGTSITEGTANFLANRRMNKSQQMR